MVCGDRGSVGGILRAVFDSGCGGGGGGEGVGGGGGGHFVSISVMVVAFCGSLTSLLCSMCVFLLPNVHGGKNAY